ncbi:unnamed protein product [Rhizopus microsporus]
MALCLNDYTAQSYVSITVFYALIPEPFYAATLNISFNKVSIIQALQELLNNSFSFALMPYRIQLELAYPNSQDLDALEISGITMHDITVDKYTLIFVPSLFIVGDNVRHAEFCLSKVSHAVVPVAIAFGKLILSHQG